MRLIDADEILKKCNGGNCWYIPREAIEEAPTVEKEPRAKGEWITDKDGYSVCSECGFSFGCIECPHEETDFCPKCGARLDKGGEDECTYL